MKRKKYICGRGVWWSFCWLLSCCSITQVYSQPEEEWLMMPIQLPDVYSKRSVNAVIKDEAGIIWIANNSGLYWYDGEECQLFTNPHLNPQKTGRVYQLVEDANQRLWILGEKGLWIMDKSRSNLEEPTSLGLSKSILQAPGLSLCQGKEQDVFILSDHTIYIWTGKTLKVWARYPQTPPKTQHRVVLLFSQKENLLYWYLPDQSDPYSKRILIYRKDGSIVDLSTLKAKSRDYAFLYTLTNAFADSVRAFTVSEAAGPTLAIHFSKDYQTRKFTEQDPDPGFSLQTIYNEFITKFQRELDINNIGRVHIFRLSKDLLALSSSEGVLLLQQQPKLFKRIEATIGQRIRAIQKDDYGHLIFGTYSGTRYLDEHKLYKLGIPIMYAWRILSLPSQAGRFVMQGEDITNQLHFLQSSPQGVRLTHSRSNFGDNTKGAFNTCMAIDTSLNGIWHLSNNHYLSFYDLSKDQNHSFRPALAEREERAMAVVGNHIWVGGHRGLRLFSKPDFATHTYQDLSQQIPKTIRSQSINAMHWVSEHEVWIGTNNQGLFRYNVATKHFEQFTTQEGLSENTVYSILAEPHDKVLWVGTGRGLCRLDIQRRWFDNYYTEDGLSNNEFNTAAAFRAANGTMYLGGQNGINYFHPKHFRTTTHTLRQFALIQLKTLNLQGNPPISMVSPGESVLIAPSVKMIEIRLRTDDYIHAPQIRYRYRIPGLWEHWEYNRKGNAIFTTLPAGKHVMEVQVQSYRGMWLPPVRYILNVLPPWHATWWFRSLVVLAVAALLYGLYWLRIRQLKQEFSMRQQLSNDLHDNLGSKMFLLQSLGHQLSNPSLSEADRKKFLPKLEDISQDLFKSIRNFIWSFDPNQDEVASLFQRMDDFAENYLEGALPQGVEVNCEDVSSGYKLTPKIKQHLMSIYQELLTNMVKHTHSIRVVIDLFVEKKILTIRIQNWHAGVKLTFKKHNLDLHWGHESVQRRLSEIGAEMEWKEPVEGQQVASVKVRL